MANNAELPLELTRLAHFVRVVDDGGFTGAATSLGTTKSTVSERPGAPMVWHLSGSEGTARVKITPRVRANSSEELMTLMTAGTGIGCPPALALATLASAPVIARRPGGKLSSVIVSSARRALRRGSSR